MNLIDVVVFIGVTIFISLLGVLKAHFSKPIKRQDVETEKLIGSNVSILPVALSVCSSFISAISLLGYPAEIYYRGSFIYWYCLMYLISFPSIAYIFLPTFYELKLPSLYEYLERRFSFTCRILTSTIFLLQTILYSGLILYAPALALSSALKISIFVAIFITGFLSALYLCMGGARAGIYTSALQMALVFISLFVIVVISYFQWGFDEIYDNAKTGMRLKVDDFRVDPRVRHGFFPLIIGGSFNIFALYASNQQTMQRYLSMPSLKDAQKVLLINIPMNIFMMTMYVFLGLIMYSAFIRCHPNLSSKDQLLPYFLESKLGWIIGLEGIFLAAVYSAGLGALTASYNALTAVTLEDIIKQIVRIKYGKQKYLSEEMYARIITYLPLFFACLSVSLAIVIKHLEAMILQIAFSIFGSAGGIIFGVFYVGLFCPWIKSSFAVILGEIASFVACILVVAGTFIFEVKPVNLPLETSCNSSSNFSNFTASYEWNDQYNRVVANSDTFLPSYSQISYQYYALVGVVVNLLVANLVQLVLNLLGYKNNKSIDPMYLSHLIRPYLFSQIESRTQRNQEMPLLENLIRSAN